MKAGIQGFSEALRKELGPKGIKVGLVEPGMTGADFQLPDIPVEKQREMINADKMLRAEDIAVAVHFMLSQPRRAVVQQLAMTERIKELQPWFNGEYVVVLRNGTRLTLSRGYRDRLQDQLGRM